MIQTLQELNEVINAVANRALDCVAERSSSGQRYVDHSEFADLISQEDYLKYADLIVNELNTREEMLEPVVFSDGELDINMGLEYCKFYQWCDGDEEIFKCTFDEWLERPAKPVYHPLSLTRMAQIGEKAADFLLDFDNYGLPLTAEDLGLQTSEIQTLESKDNEPVEYIPNQDLYLGKWRIHIADTGEKHGTFMHLVNERKPIVEFYDMSHIDPKFCPNGQFTGGGYYVDSILRQDDHGNENYPSGLLLQGDCPEWTVSHKEMKKVVAYLKSFEEFKGTRKPQLSHMISSAQQKAESSSDKNIPNKAPEEPQH